MAASGQPRSVSKAVLEVALQLEQGIDLLAGRGDLAALADDAAGQPGSGAAMQAPLMAFDLPILGDLARVRRTWRSLEPGLLERTVASGGIVWVASS